MKKILTTICLTVLILTASVTAFVPARIQSVGAQLWDSTTGQQAICRGKRDFGTFLSALISYDDFKEYWKDIFVRYNSNICQYTDIDALEKRITAVRKQIRAAFYVCADTTKMKDTYYKLEAELFYLRRYINTENGTFIPVNIDTVKNDLKDYFVINKGYFTDDKMTTLFNELKIKYTTRLETYKYCKDPSWQNLLDKWNEFRENAGGFGPAMKQASSSFKKRWERMANTPMKGGQSFLGGFLDARINGLPAKEGLDLIMQEIRKNTPGGFTFGALAADKNYKDKIQAENLDSATYIAQYQAQYGETADDYTFQIMATLNMLDDIIKTTAPYQNQTIQCTKRLNNKQC